MDRDPQQVCDILRQRLREMLPGHEAHNRMAPHHRRDPELHGIGDRDCRDAGVLALLDLSDDPTFVLTIRKNDLNNHAGQISFPGGKCEDGETHIQAALRETYEEIGACPSGYRVAGALTPLFIPPSNFCVHPFLGIVTQPTAWQLDTSEVDSLLPVRFSVIRNGNNVREHMKQIRDLRVKVPYYDVDGNEVWGATAMMLSEIVDVLNDVDLF